MIKRTSTLEETLKAMEAGLAGKGPKRIIQGDGDTTQRRPVPRPLPPAPRAPRLQTPESVQLRKEAQEAIQAAHACDHGPTHRRELSEAYAMMDRARCMEEDAAREAAQS